MSKGLSRIINDNYLNKLTACYLAVDYHPVGRDCMALDRGFYGNSLVAEATGQLIHIGGTQVKILGLQRYVGGGVKSPPVKTRIQLDPSTGDLKELTRPLEVHYP
jgi:hypothetical protein